MRKTLSSLVIALMLGWSGLASAGDFQRGWEAYQAGDYATALREFRDLAEQGHALSQYNLGTMYGTGRGVTQDYAAAEKWYRLAAEQGDARAQNNLGLMYYKGQGVVQDYAEAEKWFRLAAEQGVAEAQGNLGMMYGIGQGVVQDFVIAHMWLNIAAASGHKKAVNVRDLVEKELTSTQIAEAQKLAREWMAEHPSQ